MTKVRTLAAMALMAPTLFMATSVAGGEFKDPRERTYVYPTRIVWQREHNANEYGARFAVEHPESLLERKLGQVPELVPASGKHCRLVNHGVVPSLLLDFGRELAGSVQLAMNFSGENSYGMKLRLRFGESVAEAMCSLGEKEATNDHALRDAVIDVPAGGSVTFGETGFRFLRIDLVTTGEVQLDYVRAVSMLRPMAELGAFRCSDERLNRIWETSKRTVQLCCQERLWDGIKRDRLVWMGDMHPEAMSILNVFGPDSVLKESMDYMVETTDPKRQWMNGIVTYTLWWVRCLREFYLYSGDLDYLRRHHDYLCQTVEHMLTSITSEGCFTNSARIFIDWPSNHNWPSVMAAAQGLAVLAFRDAGELAEALGDAQLGAKCQAAKARLVQQAQVEPHASKQAAAMLALSGLRESWEMYDAVLSANGHTGVSTFYGYYVLEAMSKAGEDQRALTTVRDFWGAMLDVGATSFWEDFKLDWTNNCFRIDELPVAGKKDIHGDYGEFCYPGFRHSLCHGWSSGPASWLINHVLGIRPLKPGCTEVELKPFLGDLEWAEGAMALPNGRRLRVSVRRNGDRDLEVRVEAPKGVKLRYDPKLKVTCQETD